MNKSRRLLAQENLPISRELVRYKRLESIPIAHIADRFSVSTPRVVALVGALMRSLETWQRLADHYGLTDTDRPAWVGAGSSATSSVTEHPTPTGTPGSYTEGRENARSSARTLASPAGMAGNPAQVESPPNPVFAVSWDILEIAGIPNWEIKWSDGGVTWKPLTPDEIRMNLGDQISPEHQAKIEADLQQMRKEDRKKREAEEERKAREKKQREEKQAELNQATNNVIDFRLKQMLYQGLADTKAEHDKVKRAKQDVEDMRKESESRAQEPPPSGPSEVVKLAEAVVEVAASLPKPWTPSPEQVKQVIEIQKETKALEKENMLELFRLAAEPIKARKRRTNELFEAFYENLDRNKKMMDELFGFKDSLSYDYFKKRKKT